MSYYFRAFCTAEAAPKLAEVLQWVREREVPVSLDPADAPKGEAGVEWGATPLGIRYAEKSPPFLAELDRNEGEDSLAGQEIGEFIHTVEALKKSPRKRNQVLEHLRKTRFVVACEIPPGGFDDAGFHAVDVFLAYFLVHSGAMVQADGQGFYEMGKLILELEG